MYQDMTVSLIFAADEMDVIGFGGKLPWEGKQRGDMAQFVNVTRERGFVIVGRKTHEEIGHLKKRVNIVVTRNESFKSRRCVVVHSPEEALDFAWSSGAKEVVFIGGETLFKEAMPYADVIYFTRIHASFEGDAHAPEIDTGAWEETNKEDFPADSKNRDAYTFYTFVRKNRAA